MPPQHTHLENWFFEIEYIKLIQDSFPLMYCVETWHSDPIYRVGVWHSDPIIPCRNVTLWSNNIVSECDTPIQLPYYFISSSLLYSRRHFNREGSRLENQQSHNFSPTTNHTIKNIQPHNQVHSRLYNITQYISIAI